MKKTALFLGLILSFCSVLQAQFPVDEGVQDSFSPEYLQQFAHPIQIDQNDMKGPGWNVLEASLDNTQFVILGEYHGSASISRFTQALLPKLSQHNFNHFAVEIGPNSAPIMEELAAQPAETLSKLHEFYSKYYMREDEDIPIPFFDGKEDAGFLAEAKKQGYHLWGLDQEYFSSGIMLGDRLLELKKGAKNLDALKKAKTAYDSTFLDACHRDNIDEKGFRMFKTLIESPEVAHYFSFFENHPKGQSIIKALYKSWDIYDRNYYRGGYSHGHRISYIRENFIKNYQAASEKMPKVLVKIGAFHAAKSYAGSVYDVGNLAQELAQRNGTNCVNIHFESRYYEEDGKITDESENAYSETKRLFQQLGKKDQYILVDLRPMLRQMKSHQLKMPNDVGFHYLKYLLENFDFLVINPTDREVEANYLVAP